MFVRHKVLSLGLFHHRRKESPGDVTFQQPVPIGREVGVAPDFFVGANVHEQAKKKVVIQLLHQHAFAPDRAEHLDEQGPQEALRRNRRTTPPRVERAQFGRQPSKRRIRHLRNRPQRMVHKSPRLQRNVAEQFRLIRIRSSQHHIHKSYSMIIPVYTGMRVLYDIQLGRASHKIANKNNCQGTKRKAEC